MFQYIILLFILIFIVIKFARIRTIQEPFRNNDAVVCCIAKNEENYLNEWVNYNLKLGFSHIYIYDNSDNNSLKRFFTDNRVKVIHMPGKQKQIMAYNDFLKKYSAQHTWVAILDCDEFITMENYEPISDYLKKHCASGSLGLSWRLFGDSGKLSYSAEPVLERFTMCEYEPNLHVKVIARCEDVESIPSPHYVTLKPGKQQRDPTGRIMGVQYYNDKPTLKGMYINHYFCKTREEWKKKQARGKADLLDIRPDNDFDRHNFNEVEDTRARDWFRRGEL